MDQESGFINSQPCIAELMTTLPHINESFHRTSSITGGSGPVMPAASTAAVIQHQQQQQQHQLPQHTPALSSCNAGTLNVIVNVGELGPLSQDDSPKNGQSSAEFAWMKEKKTTRKQQHQGKLKGKKYIFLIHFQTINQTLFWIMINVLNIYFIK